jgi:hypothetical protein
MSARLVVGDDRAADLHARSGGHPLFLVGLAAAVGIDSSLPASLREAIATRCGRAGPEAAATLHTAALLGPVVAAYTRSASDSSFASANSALANRARECIALASSAVQFLVRSHT